MKKNTTQQGLWKRLCGFMNTYTSLVVIIAAALLLELTTGLMYYAAQSNLQSTMERLVRVEMNAVYLRIRSKLASAEMMLDNMAWVVKRDLANAEWMFETPAMLVSSNPFITSGGVCFAPYYYPQKGRLFEPVAIRRDNGAIEVRQIASDQHDYTKTELYTAAVMTGKSHWSQPYFDKDGSQEVVTSYSVPVHTDDGKTVAVVFADVSVDWIDDVMSEAKVYKSTQRFLATGNYRRLAGDDSPVFKKALRLLEADADNDGYTTIDDERGEKLHVFYTPVGGNTDWVLIAVLNDSEVFGRLRTVRFLLLLPVMAGLFFAGFIVWRSSRNLERLREANAEKDRIQGELRVANTIQQSMLPAEEMTGGTLAVRGSLMPAREVGGDIYDYFVRDGKLFFCIGDVSGKGAPAAMLMAVCHTLFRSASAHENNPARIMQAINETACQGNDSNMFITLFIGVLNLSTGRLHYCDAGHDAPIITDNGLWAENKHKLSVEPHLPVGVFDDTAYTSQEAVLCPGSTIFLYTDGLTEAKNKEHKQFGLQRVMSTLDSCTDKEPLAVLNKVKETVRGFVKDADQSDDLTMLVIRYTPEQHESTLTETEF
ncbi:MAG: SpoIIE family protein phosphatase [Prevotella sp.]|nr:SpoIIE family protein phosphatase [Prevotella sp.]MBO6187002.1 SpoIIE family protein phosphatase [Prevotella sp.]